MVWGADGTANDTSAANPLPVVQTGALPAGSNLVGTVEVADSGGTNKLSVSAAGAAKVDGSAVTQPVSAASLPLPTGASTAAKQPALGTAGAASADVITIQGVASMTAVKVDGSGVTQPVSGTVTADTELPAAGALTDGMANPTTPTVGASMICYNGTTWDRVRGNTSQGLFVNVTGVPANQTVDFNKIAGTVVDVNSGNKSAGTQRVVLATDQPQLTNALKVDPSAVTSPVSLAAQPGATTLANNQVTVDATVGGVTVVSSRATRRKVTIVNHGTTDVYIGQGTVTTSNGLLLVGTKGAGISIETTAAVKAIVGSGSQVVSYLEEYD